MSALTIEVQSRVFGASRTEPALDTVLVDLLQERITMAELIRRTVEEQVRDITTRKKLDLQKARRALDRQYLTSTEIAAQAKQGTVRFPSSREAHETEIDAAAEVTKALRAFEFGSYVIMVNGRQVEGLHEEFTFAPGAKVTFLRLMPLVGG